MKPLHEGTSSADPRSESRAKQRRSSQWHAWPGDQISICEALRLDGPMGWRRKDELKSGGGAEVSGGCCSSGDERRMRSARVSRWEEGSCLGLRPLAVGRCLNAAYDGVSVVVEALPRASGVCCCCVVPRRPGARLQDPATSFA